MSEKENWQDWSRTLQRWGLKDIAVVFLEAFRPLAFLGAQIIYIGQPLLNRDFSSGHLETLAQMLEDSSETQAFINYLREESPK
jgi:hypothetical protein